MNLCHRRFGSLRPLGILLVGASLLSSPVASQGAPQTDASADALQQWADKAWDGATSQTVTNDLELVAALPAGADQLGLDGLAQAIASYNAHIAEREAARATRLEELEDELAQSLDENDALQIGKTIQEKTTLVRYEELPAFLASPEISAAVERVEGAAKDAEKNGQWVEALSLYSLLNLIYEEQLTYKKDLERQSKRVAMLQLYTPELLHTMHSAQRVEEGEDALPPYVDSGDPWNVKLADVNERMVIEAINSGVSRHIDRPRHGEMILGGLTAVRTMVTTRDLQEVFPGLSEDAKVSRFLADIDFASSQVAKLGTAASSYNLRAEMRKLLANNEDSVQIEPRALLHSFGNGAMGVLDEHSGLIWPHELAYFSRTTSGNFSGVGISVTLNDAMELKVEVPLSGTPAFHAGIIAGDIITQVDGRPTLGLSLQESVELITGQTGTPVTLSIRREGEDGELEVTMNRARIPIVPTKGWERTGTDEQAYDWFIDDENKIGYIRLSQFTSNASDLVGGALKELRAGGVQGLILDLRGNAGGVLGEAVNIANFFVDGQRIDGDIVSQIDASGRVAGRQGTYKANGRLAVPMSVPMVVLVNGGSASASEIVSGALQDHGRAILVGDRTYGKGSVQGVWNIDGRNAGLKITTHYYRLPGGRLIHRTNRNNERWGVEPDITVEMLPEQFKESLEVRRNADSWAPGDDGEPVFNSPDELIDDGLDLQLETALLLIRTQVEVERTVAALEAE